MAGRFQGFAQEGLTFLQQVKIENDKTWFEEHRLFMTAAYSRRSGRWWMT